MFRRSRDEEVPSDLVPFDLWGSQGWCNQEVVGESHYLPALRRLFEGKPDRDTIECTAFLIPEPTNRHDPNAVAVHIDDAKVGHLPREVARTYQPMLLGLRVRGQVARVNCRVWGGTFTDWDDDGDDRFGASVTVALAEPHLCLPVNSVPDVPHVLLPRGSSIQVSGEDQHMPAISPFLRPEGECFAYATVRAVDETTARTTKELVEVYLDERPVGRLTPKTSGDLVPAIRHLDAMGYATAVMARIKGNRLKAEVTLHCARAHELPSDWPGELPEDASPTVEAAEVPAAARSVVHAPIPPKPTRIWFAVPPGWPPPPEGWEPPPGWQPDPAWPPAPAGWQYWVAE